MGCLWAARGVNNVCGDDTNWGEEVYAFRLRSFPYFPRSCLTFPVVPLPPMFILSSRLDMPQVNVFAIRLSVYFTRAQATQETAVKLSRCHPQLAELLEWSLTTCTRPARFGQQ